MIVRHFDRSKDSPEDLSRLNPFPPEAQEWLAKQYASVAFPEQNIAVAEVDGELVGILHIFDGGFPWAIFDGFYLKPEYRSLENALKLGHFAEDELKRRGVPVYITYAPERLARGLSHSGLIPSPVAFTMLSRRFED